MYAYIYLYIFIFVFIYLIFFAVLCGMWDLSSLTRDQTCASCIRSVDF